MQQLAEVSAKPEFRKAAANFGWLVAERAVRLLLGVLVGFLVVRYLGPERMGALSYCLAVVTLLGFLPSLGLEGPLKRDVLREPGKSAELLASSLLLRLVAGAVAYSGLLLVMFTIADATGDERRLMSIVGLLLFQPSLLVPDLWLQTQLRAKWSATVQLSTLAVASLARLWLVLHQGSLIAFAGVLAIEMMVGGVAVYWIAHRGGLRMPWQAARWETMRRLLNESWPLMFASLAIVVYMKIDEVMLRHMVGVTAVGTYAAAVRLSEVWYFLPMGLASSLLPALMRAREAHPEVYALRLQQYFDLSAGAAYALSIPIALAAPWIVRIAYGDAFAAAGPILAVHIWSSIFVFIGVARGQWLVNEGLQTFYLAATCAGALANILLNLVLIPRWAGLGAAYATVISYALAGWGASYFHPAVRGTAGMQTRALLIPFLGWRYFRR